MRNKGFTLIELLAVIVVLAIIALIATPIAMNVIKDAQKGAAERSAERYVAAVETAIAADRLENDMIKDGIYTVDVSGNLVLDDKTLTVAVSGDKPASGSKVAIKNGKVVKDGTNMSIGDYIVTINDNGSATATAAGDVVALCNAAAPSAQPWYDTFEWVMSETIAGVQATEAAPYAAGAVYTCDLGDGARTFYVLGTDGDNVKLIMNENIGNAVEWAPNRDNSKGPVTANAYLASQTSGWTKLKEIGGTVELPDAQDIADAMGDTEWNDASETDKEGPTWLCVNIDGDNGPYGYWTSTPSSDASHGAWTVIYDGSLNGNGVDDVRDTAVRPVIVIPKKELSL